MACGALIRCCPRIHAVHARPLSFSCQSVRSSRQQQSVLDWSSLEKPWQTWRIMLQFLSSASFSRWIPTSSRTSRTSGGGKVRLKGGFVNTLLPKSVPSHASRTHAYSGIRVLTLKTHTRSIKAVFAAHHRLASSSRLTF